MSKIIVTGGAGFIGSHTVDRICKDKFDTAIVVDINLNINKSARYYGLDIRDTASILNLFELIHPQYVIHCAAKARIQPSLSNPITTYQTNVIGTLNILEACRKFKVKKIVYSGSSSVYAGYSLDALPLTETLKPLPLNPYAYSKLMAEMLIGQYVQNYGLRACILRYFNVYGPRQPTEGQYATVIGIFLRQLKNNEPFTIVPDGNQRRDFTWVGDVVDANILAMESDTVYKGEIINIGSGKNYSILEVAEMVGGKGYPAVFIKPRKGEAKATLADISKAKKFLGWEPKISLKKGIEILTDDNGCRP